MWVCLVSFRFQYGMKKSPKHVLWTRTACSKPLNVHLQGGPEMLGVRRFFSHMCLDCKWHHRHCPLSRWRNTLREGSGCGFELVSFKQRRMWLECIWRECIVLYVSSLGYCMGLGVFNHFDLKCISLTWPTICHPYFVALAKWMFWSSLFSCVFCFWFVLLIFSIFLVTDSVDCWIVSWPLQACNDSALAFRPQGRSGVTRKRTFLQALCACIQCSVVVM